MRKLPFLLLFAGALFASASASAQITGTVTDETGNQSFVVAIPPLATPADVATPADKPPIWVARWLRSSPRFERHRRLHPQGPGRSTRHRHARSDCPRIWRMEGIGAENLVPALSAPMGTGR